MSKSTRDRWEQQTNIRPVAAWEVDLAKASEWLDERIRRAKATGPFIEQRVDVSAPLAAALLGRSKGNARPESAGYIASVVRDILDGRCLWTHQGAALDEDGVLYDAHHRLKAVIKAGESRAGVAMQMNIAFGYPREAVRETDGGRPRSSALRMGENSKVVASVRAAFRIERGVKHANFTRAELEDGLARYSRPIEALRCELQQKHPASFWGAIIYAFTLDPEKIAAFAGDVVRGAVPGTPAFTLREYLSKADSAGQDNQAEIAKRSLYAVRAAIWGSSLTKFAPKDGDSIFDWFRTRVHGKGER